MMSEAEYDRIILTKLEEMEDPRSRRGIRYKYAHVLLICIYAILCGHSEATEIEYYAELHEEYFRKLLGIGRIPSHDTIDRIMCLTDMDVLSAHLQEWLNRRFPEQCKKYDGYTVLHVDGKAVKGASKKSSGEKPLYLMDAQVDGAGMSVQVQKVGEKENEISVLPDYLRQFRLEGTIVTVDAMGCNSTVIGAIKEKKGKYLLPVKENQPKLRRLIEEKEKEYAENGKIKSLPRFEKIRKDHGRIEKLRMTMIENTAFIYEALGSKSCFNETARVGIYEKWTEKTENGKEVKSYAKTYLITDVEGMSAETMLEIKLSHWNVESSHWLLDVHLNEDRKTLRTGNGVQTASVLRRFCLSVRKYDPLMEGKPLKRFLMRNMINVDKIEEILFGGAAHTQNAE